MVTNKRKPLTVYKASAGSGKTFTLATEYIRLLIENPQSYRTILAVTFTNKATEEMKTRILSQLYGIWKQLPDSAKYMDAVQKSTGFGTEMISERAGIALNNLIHNYNYFQVQTIDTFFQSVLRNMARELDLTTNLRIGLNDTQVEEMAVDQLIADLSTTDIVLQWIMKYILESISDDKSWNVIAQIKKFGRTIFRDEQGRDVYLNFRIMPVLDNNGEVTHYLGMCRDVTEMTYTERRLQVETAKAQEEEQLKNTFLLNMSYELRTPLNAVIGFAELFGAEHNEEDEPIFAEEIKKNTNTLLKLINDILFLSRLDAHMIEFNYQETDFAMLFEGWCYMGWSNLSPDVKVVVENPYNSLLVTIDQQNLSTVIQKLCVYTGQNTQEGTVRAKYEYRHGELMITIEDTGKGLDADGLKKAFDRFAHEEGSEDSGTGLGLPIVRELIEQMNGTIELQSERGKGSTFFVSIPCEMSTLEKKAEITV